MTAREKNKIRNTILTGKWTVLARGVSQTNVLIRSPADGQMYIMECECPKFARYLRLRCTSLISSDCSPTLELKYVRLYYENRRGWPIEPLKLWMALGILIKKRVLVFWRKDQFITEGKYSLRSNLDWMCEGVHFFHRLVRLWNDKKPNDPDWLRSSQLN